MLPPGVHFLSYQARATSSAGAGSSALGQLSPPVSTFAVLRPRGVLVRRWDAASEGLVELEEEEVCVWVWVGVWVSVWLDGGGGGGGGVEGEGKGCVCGRHAARGMLRCAHDRSLARRERVPHAHARTRTHAYTRTHAQSHTCTHAHAHTSIVAQSHSNTHAANPNRAPTTTRAGWAVRCWCGAVRL
jgi:hypothetical protein